MPNEKIIDPFKPSQPQIPGVAAVVIQDRAERPPSLEAGNQIPRKNRWPIAATVGGVLILAGFIAWGSRSSSPDKNASDGAGGVSGSGSTALASQPAQNLPVGPGEIATTEELSKPWSAKRFLFRNPLTDETLPAMVVRLPGGNYWGLSAREPFGTCEMELVTDLEKLQTYYNFRADHPLVGDPCDRSLFDLTRFGTTPGGLVRGEVETGPAIRPPVAIEIRTRGNQVLAVRME